MADKQTRGVPKEVDRVKCLIFGVNEAQLLGACDHQNIYELYVPLGECLNLSARLPV